MKSHAFLCHLVFVLGWAFSTAQAQEERITHFDSQLEIAADGSLTVTETLAVVSAQQEIKRGIFRDFPVEHSSAWGLRQEVGFEVEEVLRDGKPEPWTTNATDVPGSLRLYLGDAGRLLPPGPHTYTLRYRTTRQLHVGQDYDELYWNVTGNAWAFPIDRATARVILPGGAPVSGTKGFTGPTGATGQDWQVLAETPGTVTLGTTRSLLPGEGFTISVTWPKGFLDPSVQPDSLASLLAENTWVVWTLLGLLAVFVYYTTAWVLVGRDPPKGTIIPQFAPPEGLTPSAVRFIRGLGTFDDRSFGSAIIQLAVSGALRIQKVDNYHLIRTDTPAKLLPGQKKFLEALFAEGSPVVLVQKNHALLTKAKSTLRRWLQQDFEKQFFLRNTPWCLVGALLSLVPAIVALLQSQNLPMAAFMMVWLSIWTVGVVGLLSSVVTQFRAGQWLLGLPLMLFSLPFLAGWIFGAAMLFWATSPLVVAVFVAGSLMNAIFYHLLKAPTLEGQGVMDHIEGFRHYLSVAERDRLDAMAPPQQTPELFEKFLPYALALEVEQKWSEQFAEVLTAAHYNPTWCSGQGLSGAGVVNLGPTLGSSMFSSLSAAATAPRSSGGSGGSGGGGSSGGGGGGGGGGGW